MGSTLDRAARVGDPVEHSHRFLGGALGAVIGVGLGVAIIALTAPISIPAIAAAGVIGGTLLVAGAAGTAITATMLGESLGEMGGALVAAPNAGDIANGSPTVRTGPDQPKAARMNDPLKCHPGKLIAQGSSTVFIEGWNASRKGDGTMCDGKIQDGCASVLIGGAPSSCPDFEDRSELPGPFRVGKAVLSTAGDVLGFVTGKGEIVKGVDLAIQLASVGFDAYGHTNLPGHETVADVGGDATGATALGKSLVVK